MMNRFFRRAAWAAACLLAVAGCRLMETESLTIPERIAQYTTVRLSADLASLTPAERRMIPLLVKAGEEMDAIFWKQAGVSSKEYLAGFADPDLRRCVEINYGPWDRLRGNEPFVRGVGVKPLGAGFYPADMTRDEFEAHLAEHPEDAESFRSLYTVIRRDGAGRLVAVPYHVEYASEMQRAAELLEQAAGLAEDAGLKRYLELRARALVTSDYRPSDLAWMDMKTNRIDVVIGPIETYEDRLFGYKASAECFVLIKDLEWSRRLERYAALLPDLQKGLPVDGEYKREEPGGGSDLNAYDAVFYAGDCNSGSKTIAINLPNDEVVQQEKGARRLQLKNSMRAKFDKILVPIAGRLMAEDQRRHVTFDAFFTNTMFHEVAHGLGIKQTIEGNGTVREALREHYSAMEEGKADILGLYLVTRLVEDGVLTEGSILDHYVTAFAGIFRSARFGASSAHGRANMVRFNFFERMGAFERDEATGTYRVNEAKMKEAITALSRQILVIQGDGDHEGAGRMLEEMGRAGRVLRADLDRISREDIPVDVVFEQGLEALGLDGD
ncbi:MAG: Zn-dependent hydrolase [Planctomycetes bacterium]|nr:Zn-dependent hydrolase [Planctomycetota bacterium]